MPLRHLFGPVTSEFADQNLFDARRCGDCLTFGPAAGDHIDVVVTAADTWTDVVRKLPPGWEPAAVALYLPYTVIPAGLWSAPVPLVGLAADWNLQFHHYRTFLPRCDLVLTDTFGVGTFHLAELDHARPANLFGLERAFLDEPWDEVSRDIDVLFVGNLSPHVQRDRSPWLARLARLGARWNVHIASGVFGGEYRALLRRSRIVFNRSIRYECNKRTFEAAACGALLLQEAENGEVRHWLAEGAEFALYTAADLEAVVERYLSHEDERAAVADAGRVRVQGYGFDALWAATLERIREEWPAVVERAARRCEAPPAESRSPSVPLLEDVARADAAVRARDGAGAMTFARRALWALNRDDGLPAEARDAQPWPATFDLARVEWERAAWANACDIRAELGAKAAVLRWHLHALLATQTGDLAHYYEAALARPDLPTPQAALGCALARANRTPDAMPHLRAAAAAQPFDLAAVKAYAQALADLGQSDARARLAAERWRLAKAAPGIIPVEEWFAAPPDPQALASVIIPCWDEVEATRVCLDSVRRHTRQPYELILIDNGSTDATPALFAEARDWPEPARVEVNRNETNLGYPAGVNQGLAAARGEYLVLLNNDTAVTPGWLDRLIEVALREGAALVGPVTNYAPPPQQVPAGYADLCGLDAFALERARQFSGRALPFDRLTGFCLLVRRDAFATIGGLDEGFGDGFFDDDDLCAVRKAGLKLCVALGVYVHHEGSRTFRAHGIDTGKLLAENFEKFRAKWGDETARPYQMPAAPPSPPEPTFTVTSADLPATGRARVSVTIIAKNEEKNLPDCVASVRDLAYEVIVLDTGSTDRTKEVARQLGAKVFDFVWEDSFAAARNEALKHATGDWVFWLDADDRVDKANHEKLGRMFTSLPDENVAFSMKCRCVAGAGGIPETVVDHVRLFRNDQRVRWRHRVHEQILMALRDVGAEVRFADVEIQHVGYTDPATQRAKAERNLRLLLLEQKEMPDHPFTLFNLGSTYLDLGRPAEALPPLRRSLERSAPGDSIVRKAYALVAGCHLALRQPAEAVGACAAGRTHYPDDAELLYRDGMARSAAGDAAGAEACYRRLIDGREAGEHFGSTASGLRGSLGRNGLAAALFDQKRYAEAEAQWRSALTLQPGYRPAWLGLADLYLQTERWELLEQAASELGDTADAAVARGRARLARKEFAAARWVLSQACDQFPQAVAPRVYLSHALLQEGQDWLAAERALRDVLRLEPDNAGAKNNLEVLLRDHGPLV